MQYNQYGDNLRRKSEPSKIGTLLSLFCVKLKNPFLCHKLFYFCFCGSFGCLFPLLGIYFKQLGLSAAQTGILVGLRPIIEFLFTPIWSIFSRKYYCKKIILLLSLVSWLICTIALSLVQPAPSYCLSYNGTAVIIIPAYMDDNFIVQSWKDRESDGIKTTSLPQLGFSKTISTNVTKSYGTNNYTTVSNQTKITIPPSKTHKNLTRKTRDAHNKTQYIIYTYDKYILVNETHVDMERLGKSPIYLNTWTVANLEEMAESNSSGLISPSFSSIVYRYSNVSSSFMLLLIIMIITEVISSPALIFADMATLQALDGDYGLYTQQRIYGSIGWAICMFVSSIALEKSISFNDFPCGETQIGEHNYIVAFVLFSIMMIFSILIASTFKFENDTNWLGTKLSGLKRKLFSCENEDSGENVGFQQSISSIGRKHCHKTDMKREEQLASHQDNHLITTEQGIVGQRDYLKPSHAGSLYSSSTNSNANYTQNQTERITSEFIPVPQNYSYTAENVISINHFIQVSKVFFTHFISLLFIIMVFFIGTGFGLIFTFLFWHLQDLRATPVIFGLVSVLNHISEIVFALKMQSFFEKQGQKRTLALGLLTNFIRFIFISIATNPWLVMLVEWIQGFTHVAVWNSCCLYLLKALAPELRATGQFTLHTIYYCFGRSVGILIGGVMISNYGTIYTFKVYATFCTVFALIFTCCLLLLKKKFEQFESLFDNYHDTSDNNIHFSPVGVPINPLSMGQRCLSMNEIQQNTNYLSTDNPEKTQTLDLDDIAN